MHDNDNLVDKYNVKNLTTTSKSAKINAIITANHENIEIYSDDNDYLGDIEDAELKIELSIIFSIEELIYFLNNSGQDCRIDDSQIELINFELLDYKSKDNIDKNIIYKCLKNNIEQYYNPITKYSSTEYELYIRFSE